jgi:L-lactate permease
MALYGGWRSIRSLWPVLAVAGLSFGLAQFGASNYLDYTLTDVFAALASLAVTLLFLQVWRPAPTRNSSSTTNRPKLPIRPSRMCLPGKAGCPGWS